MFGSEESVKMSNNFVSAKRLQNFYSEKKGNLGSKPDDKCDEVSDESEKRKNKKN